MATVYASRRRDSRCNRSRTDLFISPKTADRHIQHIYGKIWVFRRGLPPRCGRCETASFTER